MLTDGYLPQRGNDCNRSLTSDPMITKLPDEILLSIFDFYRQSFGHKLSSERNWNSKVGWFKLAHVCRNWRCIVLSSSSRLRLRLYFTTETPTSAAMLTSLPPLPVVLDYPDVTWTPHTQNRLTSALRYSNRVCGIAIAVATRSGLNPIPNALDICFPALESLELYNTNRRTQDFNLPPTFLMTSMKSLRRLLIRPTRLVSLPPLLSATTVLIDLTLSIDLVMCARPDVSLLALLRCLPRLRHLNVSIRSVYLPSSHGIPAKTDDVISLAELTNLRLTGHSTAVEVLVAGLATPSLQGLHVTLDIDPYNDIHFPHLIKLIRNVGMIFLAAQIKLSQLNQEDCAVSLLTHSHFRDDPTFNIRVNGPSSIARIGDALSAMLATVGDVFLAFDFPTMNPGFFQVSLTPWRVLFGLLQNVKILRVQHSLEMEVANMLQQDNRQSTMDLLATEEAGSNVTIPSDLGFDSSQLDLAFLPSLEEIEVYVISPSIPISESKGASALEPFEAFVAARRQAGHPVKVYWNTDQVLPVSFRCEQPW